MVIMTDQTPAMSIEEHRAYDAGRKAHADGVEEWRAVTSADARLYEVSNLGRVRRTLTGHKPTAGQLLSTSKLNRFGYPYTVLLRDGKKRRYFIHRLVAEEFVSRVEGKPEVNHKDGVKTNNHASNLEWATRAENVQHAFDSGLKHGSAGERNGRARLTAAQAAEILKLKGKVGARRIAILYGISRHAVQSIHKGWTWKELAQ